MWIWLSSRKRKNHQRAMTNYIRKVNKELEKDEQWQGRFYVRQTGSIYWELYEDGSGASLYVYITFYDKKTGLSRTTIGSVNEYRNGTLYNLLNDFICDIIKEERKKK